VAAINNRDKESVHDVLIHSEDLMEVGTCLLDLRTKTCCLTWSGICLVMLEVNEMGVRALKVFECTEISQMTNLAVRIALVGWHCGALQQLAEETNVQHFCLAKGFDMFS
jgi:hypothetical protein